MKTTLEIPDPLFRMAKSRAAERGQSLKDFVAEALEASLADRSSTASSGEPAWMTGFGTLKHLGLETARVQALIDESFDVIEAEDRL